MRNMNEKDICNIVKDLLPLYADDACNESSRRLVEEHIKTCKECSRTLNAMKQPIAVAEPSGTPKKAVKKATRRLKLRTILIFILVLVLAVPPLWLGTNEIRGDGIGFTNVDDILACCDIMKLWQNHGFDIAVQEMNPLPIKEGLSQSLLETRFVGILGRNPDKYELQDINGEKYYVVNGLFANTIQGGREFRENFWYNIVTQTSDNYLIPADIYDELVDKYGEDFAVRKYERNGSWEDSVAKKISTSCGDFYINYSENSVYTTEFDDDMKAKIPEIYDVEDLFYLAGSNEYLTPEVYAYYKKTYADVVKWYEKYADYYRNMSDEEFADNWRSTLYNFVTDYEKQGIILTDYKYKDVWRMDRDVWNVRMEATFSNGAKGTVYLSSRKGKCYIYGGYPDYDDPKSVEFFENLDNLFPEIYTWIW